MREVLPYLLPIARTATGARERFLGVGDEGLVVGRRNRGRDLAAVLAAVRRLDDPAAPPLPGVHAFRFVDIDSLSVAPVDGSWTSELRIAAGGRTVRCRVPVAPDSVVWRAIDKLHEGLLQRGEARPGPLRHVIRTGAAVVAALALGAAPLVFASSRDGAALAMLLLVGVLFGGMAWVFWRPRPVRRRRRRRTSKRASASHPGYSRPVSIGYRVAGAAALVGGYYLAGDAQDAVLGYLAREGMMRGHVLSHVSWAIWGLALWPGVWLVVRGYIRGQIDGATALARDDRAPILYLRSFDDDLRHTFTEDTWMARMCGLMTPSEIVEAGMLSRYLGKPNRAESLFRVPLRMLMLLLGRGRDTAEEQLGAALRRVGPVVAIGDPREPLPSPGAAKLYVDHAAWQGEVTALVRRAALVVVQPSTSAGVRWEVDTVLQLQRPERVVCAVQPSGDAEVRDQVLALLGWRLQRRLPDAVRVAPFVAFNEGWEPVAIGAVDARPMAWPWTGTSVDLHRTLAPVVARLPAVTAPAPDLVTGPGPALAPQPGRRSSRAARWTAAWVYGVGPLVAVSVLLFVFLLEPLWEVSPTGDLVAFEDEHLRMSLDAAWVLDPSRCEITADARRYWWNMGDGKVLIVGVGHAERAVDLQSLDIEGSAGNLVGGGFTRERMVDPEVTWVGGWPWVHSRLEFASADGERAANVGFWLLEAHVRRYWVACIRVRATDWMASALRARGRSKAVGAEDAELFDAVRNGLAHLQPAESIVELSDAGAGAPITLQGRTKAYTMPVRDGWQLAAQPISGLDLTLEHGPGRVLGFMAWQSERPDDPLPLCRQLVASEAREQPDGRFTVLEAGWRRIGDEVALVCCRRLDWSDGRRQTHTTLIRWESGKEAREVLYLSAAEGEVDDAVVDVLSMFATFRSEAPERPR